jgi:hypothetical protein
MTSITRFAATKAAVMTATAQRHTRKQVRKAAVVVNRVGRATAQAEICNEMILQFVKICYAYDSAIDGYPNIDESDGRILVYVPWSFHNHDIYNLTVTQADVMRAYLLRLQVLGRRQDVASPVFIFDPYSRRWALNIFDYPNIQRALDYWSAHELTAKLFSRYAKTAQIKRKTPRKLRDK